MTESDNFDFRSIRLIDDQPIDELERDHLGLMPWAKMIAGTAVGTQGPFTIGVHAKWGLGKTTLLRLTQRLIERQNPEVVTVWFNAWQFEREEHPLFPLIAAIADEIERKAPLSEVTTGSKRLRSIGRSLRALCRGMKFKAEVGIPGVGSFSGELDCEKALEAEEQFNEEANPLLAESMYHSAFGALEAATRREDEDDGLKIVVFVDDLDRCQPDKAVHLLENVKLILAQRGFVFVLAVDCDVLEGYLEKRYVDSCGDGARGRGRFYMEKIIQLPVHIPSHRSRFARFVERIVNDLGDKESPEIQALTDIQQVLVTGAGLNPRSLIRLVNNFLLDCKLWPMIPHVENYEALTKDLAAALAFNRILDHDLDGLFTALISDQELCETIRSRDETTLLGYMDEVSRKDRAEERSLEHHSLEQVEAQRSQVVRELLRRPELLAALAEHGKAWLRDGELRRVVNEFAQTDRATGSVEFPEPIAEAIRKELGLQADEPIPFGRLTEVKNLNLGPSNVGDADLAHLHRLSGLRSLGLWDTEVTDAGLAHLKGFSALQSLSLTRTRVTDEGLAFLERLSGLQRLYLGDLQVTDAGLAHLKGLSALQELHLWETSVRGWGLVHIKDLSGLRELHLQGSQVANGGLMHLRSLYGLRVLNMASTNMTDAGLAHLKGLSGLQELYLSGTQVTDVGLAHLKGLQELRWLYLSGTQVTDAGVRELEKAIPGLNVDR